MKYYIYPDGTISEEPLDFKATTPPDGLRSAELPSALVPSCMSDDYYVLEAQDYEEAYEMALMLGLI